MQSVVTGQAPYWIGKLPQEESKSKQKIIHTKTETNRIPQTKIKGEISVRTYQDTYISHAKRVAAETEIEETASYPQEKDPMKTIDV